VVGSERRMYFETQCVMALQGHPRSLINDFGINRKRVCDFLLVINSNLGPILPVSEILQVSGEEPPTHIPPEI